MSSLSTNLPWTQANTKWASVLNPLLANPLNGVSILENISLSIGSNVINHKLGRLPQGWIIVDKQGVADIYRSAPFNNLTLTLTSSQAVIVNIGVL
jgi:hypothetical protein